MAPPNRQVTGPLQPCGKVRLPFIDKPVIKVFRDEDGQYYTDHPLLNGRFTNHKQIGDRIRDLRDMLQFRNRPKVVMQPQPPPPRLRVVMEPPPPPLPLPSEKLVAGAGGFASGQALQDPDIASSEEESTTAGPRTAQHITIDSSSSTFPSSCDKFVVGSTKSIRRRTQHDVSYFDKLMDEIMYECHDSSLEVSMTSSPRTVPNNTTSGSLQSASSIGSKILIRHPLDCFQTFYIRMDRMGYFRTYPHVSGLFASVAEADNAIKRFLDELRHGGRCKEQDIFSCGDRMKDHYKYFLDGPRIDPNLASKTNYDRAIFGSSFAGPDLAHKLEDFVRKHMIFEDHRWFSHFNFTTKQQSDDGTSDKIFFAEVSHMQGEKAWEVNCCHMINTEKNDGGGLCYGCKNNGNPFMQHPNDTSAYIGGHLDGRSPFVRFTNFEYEDVVDDDDDDNDDVRSSSDDDDDVVVEETGRRHPLLGRWVDRVIREL